MFLLRPRAPQLQFIWRRTAVQRVGSTAQTRTAVWAKHGALVQPSTSAQPLTLRTFIQEYPASNLHQNADYSQWFSSVAADILLYNKLATSKTVSSRTLSSSLHINQPNFRRLTTCNTDTFASWTVRSVQFLIYCRADWTAQWHVTQNSDTVHRRHKGEQKTQKLVELKLKVKPPVAQNM